MRRRAFTLTEVVVSILVMGIMASAIVLSSSSSKQTANSEAERAAALIGRLIERADRTRSAFWLDVKNDRLEIRTGADYGTAERENDFNASKGCSFSRYGTDKKHLSYNVPALAVQNSTHRNFGMNNVMLDIKSEPEDSDYNIQVKSSGSTSDYYIVLHEIQ